MYPDIPIGEYAWIKRHNPRYSVPVYRLELHWGVDCIDDGKVYGVTLRLGMWEFRVHLFSPRLCES